MTVAIMTPFNAIILIGILTFLSSFLGTTYLPGAPAYLSLPFELGIILGWAILGLVFYVWAALSGIKGREPRYNQHNN